MQTKIKIVNKSKSATPCYETKFSAGMDLRANIDDNVPVTIKPMERKLIKTDLFLELPNGYEAQIRPRSGLALKHGITVLNSPGTIDSDYRGNVGVILINLSDSDFVVNQGDRVAQMVIAKYEKVNWDEVLFLEESERGSGGFGSTGKI
ncbi:MAG: dUTP diphosphatase [Candidatus Izemoplasmatales bacterium]